MENYTELYKKYRPKVWSDLVGQEKVAKSLRSAVVANKIPTAYLFAGERGTGKTSAAKILAKALNCENRDKQKGDPCNACDTCLAIDNNTQLGVEYISMAEHGSVDSIRQIVQDSKLAQPVHHKVVMLDEIHNISKAAFDAMLITLESDNTDTLFILCSTEIKKIPKTILSRTQQRKFSLLNSQEIESLLASIAEREGLEDYQDALEYAVKHARGSARDSLSLFESRLSTGGSDDSYTDKILQGIAQHNIISVLLTIAEASSNDVPLDELTENIIDDIRTIVLLSEGADEETAGVSPVDDLSEFLRQVFNTESMIYLMKLLTESYSKMVGGGSPRPLLEMSLIEYIGILKKKQALRKSK